MLRLAAHTMLRLAALLSTVTLVRMLRHVRLARRRSFWCTLSSPLPPSPPFDSVLHVAALKHRLLPALQNLVDEGHIELQIPLNATVAPLFAAQVFLSQQDDPHDVFTRATPTVFGGGGGELDLHASEQQLPLHMMHSLELQLGTLHSCGGELSAQRGRQLGSSQASVAGERLGRSVRRMTCRRCLCRAALASGTAASAAALTILHVYRGLPAQYLAAVAVLTVPHTRSNASIERAIVSRCET